MSGYYTIICCKCKTAFCRRWKNCWAFWNEAKSEGWKETDYESGVWLCPRCQGGGKKAATTKA